ncbi:MAG: hypothetical protein EZS28_031115 [Streblomastix strix]|uniref:Uncharacterized protein n=1 Tax=Streblomastix strix TaxID=222440 RepID=A0A5J4USH6_9EUKA|nr:MAG: hypothetical protein EZS28_031115 [Streblomastix strix]
MIKGEHQLRWRVIMFRRSSMHHQVSCCSWALPSFYDIFVSQFLLTKINLRRFLPQESRQECLCCCHRVRWYLFWCRNCSIRIQRVYLNVLAERVHKRRLRLRDGLQRVLRYQVCIIRCLVGVSARRLFIDAIGPTRHSFFCSFQNGHLNENIVWGMARRITSNSQWQSLNKGQVVGFNIYTPQLPKWDY